MKTTAKNSQYGFARRACTTAVLGSALWALGMTLGHAQMELEEVVVTAQKRELGLQSTPVAITAYTSENIKRNRIFTVDDLAGTVPALAFTAGNSPLDLEVNIRGIVNTRLDSPSGEEDVIAAELLSLIAVPD